MKRFENIHHCRKSGVLITTVRSIGYAALLAGLSALIPLKSSADSVIVDDLSVYEVFDLNPVIGTTVSLTDYQWYARAGDDPEWKNAEWEVEMWSPVEIGKSLTDQGFPRRFNWYRVNFELPPELEGADALLLKLGRISFFDQVFVNGVEVGSYGTHPPDRPLSGSSFVKRQYLVDGSLLKPDGENVLTVRVYSGAWGGLWEGPYELSSLDQPMMVLYDYKSMVPEEAMLHYLTDRDYLNHFYYGNPVKIRPGIIDMRSGSRQKNLQMELMVRNEADELVDRQNVDIETRHMQRVRIEPLEIHVDSPGRYTAQILFTDGGEKVGSQVLAFQVSDYPEPIRVTVDPALQASAPMGSVSRRIHEEAVGRYGARFPVYEEGTWTLPLSVKDMDNRGALTYISRLSLDEPDVLIFQNNVQPAPLQPYREGYYQDFPMGRRWDTYSDLWSFGYLSTGEASAAGMTLDLEQGDWSGRRYRFNYPENESGGSYLIFHNSGHSPAYLVETDASQLLVFDRIGKWGLGLPSHFAFAAADGIRVQSAKMPVRGENMAGNWILVWFNGSEGWDYFDVPWLFVLERQPDQVALGDEALYFQFGAEAGRLMGMPLFGVRHPALFETERWEAGLPADVAALCRKWSRILLNYPITVERDFEVDYADDRILIQDSFTYERIDDAWGTPALQMAPISPTLMVSVLSGNIDIRFDRQVEDYRLTTLHGPFTGIEDASQARFEINGLLQYVMQARKSLQAPEDTEAYEEARLALMHALDEFRQEFEMDNHPWPWSLGLSRQGRTLTPGRPSRIFSKFVLALPYLDEEMRQDYAQLLGEEIRQSYLYTGIPKPAWRDQIGEAFRDESQFTDVVDERNGMELAVLAFYRDRNRRAIDSPFWVSLQVHNVWQYAHYVDDWADVEENWDFLIRLFNSSLLSHDWATSQSWDSYSGYRIGNGIQEGPGIYAGFVAMARMADKLGDYALRDYATYYAVMQIIGTNASATGIDYVRHNRPFSAFNTESEGMSAAEGMLRHRYVEFNEFAGSSQRVIHVPFLLLSYDSFFDGRVPDAKRIYSEIWPRETEYFFENAQFPPRLEAKVYMIQSTPEAIRRAYEKQVRGEYATGRVDTIKIEAALAYLDHLGGIKWKHIE